MDDYKDLNLRGCLSNTCYGGFSFSDKFIKIINKRRAAKGEPPMDMYEERERSKPDVIELFQELGSSVASGACAKLKLYWVPEEFLKYINIHEYDGLESIGVKDTQIYTDLLKDFINERKEIPSLTIEDLEKRYTEIDNKIKRHKQFLSEVYYAKKLNVYAE